MPDRSGSTHRVREAIRRAAKECVSHRTWGSDWLLRETNAKSVAVFGRSRSYTRVKGQNPNPETRAAAVQPIVPERYVARAELAAIMGVSLATVDRMVAEGMPSVTWGRRTRRFRPSAAISWASERERAA
ncbi:MAG: hypothetical protein WAN93_10115 [Solirubrobacteraceae bacterium]